MNHSRADGQSFATGVAVGPAAGDQVVSPEDFLGQVADPLRLPLPIRRGRLSGGKAVGGHPLGELHQRGAAGQNVGRDVGGAGGKKRQLGHRDLAAEKGGATRRASSLDCPCGYPEATGGHVWSAPPPPGRCPAVFHSRSPMKFNAAAPAALCLAAITLAAITLVGAEAPPVPGGGDVVLDPSILTHPAGTPVSELEFMRLTETDGDRPAAMQTATVRFVGRPGTEFADKIVDLVGVVHIGEADYYTALNGQLSAYDTVLYELVAPDGTRITPADLKGRRSIVAGIQGGMKDLLGLEYQLERVNYMVANFRHADMSPEEFAADMAARGDSMWKMIGRMIGASLAGQATTGGAEMGMLMALGADNRDLAMRRCLPAKCSKWTR